MNFKEKQIEFAVRYYRWASEEFRTEVESGFPILKELNTRPSGACLELMRRLTRDGQIKLALALVKRFHKQAIQVVGENLDEEDLRVIDRYTNSLLALPMNRNLDDKQGLSSGGEVKVVSKNLTTIVNRKLVSALGHNPERRGGGYWRYNNLIGDLRVYTNIDVGGRSHRISYFHDVVDTKCNMLTQFASVESWLGLSSQTFWFSLSQSEVERTAQVIAELCKRFFNALPKFVG